MHSLQIGVYIALTISSISMVILFAFRKNPETSQNGFSQTRKSCYLEVMLIYFISFVGLCILIYVVIANKNDLLTIMRLISSLCILTMLTLTIPTKIVISNAGIYNCNIIGKYALLFGIKDVVGCSTSKTSKSEHVFIEYKIKEKIYKLKLPQVLDLTDKAKLEGILGICHK